MKKAIDSYDAANDKPLEPGSSEQPRHTHIPEMAKISIVNNPSEGGSISIIDENGGTSAENFLVVPIGSSIILRPDPKVGYTLDSIKPNYPVGQSIVVNADMSLTASWKRSV